MDWRGISSDSGVVVGDREGGDEPQGNALRSTEKFATAGCRELFGGDGRNGDLGVEPRLLFSVVTGQFFLARPISNIPKGRPRTRYRDYISGHALE